MESMLASHIDLKEAFFTWDGKVYTALNASRARMVNFVKI